MRWLLLILGILVLVFALFCRTRLGVRAAFGGECAIADITVGPFRIRVAPAKQNLKKKHKKTVKTAKPKKTPKDLAASAKRIPKPTWAEIKDAWGAMAPACQKALQRTRRSIKIHPLNLHVTVAGAEDPATAAEFYGNLHMAVWTGMPALEQLLVIPDPHIHVGIDFDACKTSATGELGVSIRIGTLLAVGLGMSVPALRWFLRFRKQHQQQQPPAPKTAEASETTPAA